MENKYSVKKIMLITAAVCILFLSALSAAAAYRVYHSPKATVLRALTNTLSSENLGFQPEAVYSLFQSGRFQSNSEFTISRAVMEGFSDLSYAEGGSLSSQTAIDFTEKRLLAESSVSYLMKPYAAFSLYMDADIMGLRVPFLGEDYIALDPSHIGQEINNSPISAFTGPLEPALSVQIFTEETNKKQKLLAPSLSDWLNKLQQFEIQETETAEDDYFALADNQEVTCYQLRDASSSYTIYLSQDMIYGLSFPDAENQLNYRLRLENTVLSLSVQSQTNSELTADCSFSSSPENLLSIEIEHITYKDDQMTIKVYGTLSFSSLGHAIETPFTESIPVQDISTYLSSMLS